MAFDKKGGFHMNPQVARMHDANQKPAFGHGDPKEKQRKDPGQQEDGDHGQHATHGGTLIRHHGDGTHHVIMNRHGHAPEVSHHANLKDAMDHISTEIGEAIGPSEANEEGPGSPVSGSDDEY